VGDVVGKPDEKEDRIWVQLHHEDAQFLFGRNVDDPGDLRKNLHLRGQLREKLFILWGDLEEVKEATRMTTAEEVKDDGDVDDMGTADDATPAVAGDLVDTAAETEESSNLPFECCLMEYGIQMDQDELESRELAGGEEGHLGIGLGWKRMFALFGTTIL
jgi:hypothetical protein